MNFVPLGLSFGIGIGLGWAYFLTLWKTLQRLSSTQQPAFMMWGSLMLRLLGVLTVFLCHDSEWLAIFLIELPRIYDHADPAHTTVGIDSIPSRSHKALSDYGYGYHYT